MAGEMILIIEDNEKNRTLVRDVLQATGHKTIETETAEEELKLARENLLTSFSWTSSSPGWMGLPC
jgi:CheY-like chemotaxis protein